MKKFLVRFNRPILIKANNTGEPSDYITSYGFLTPHNDYDDHERQMQNIWDYTAYLAAMHEWSSGADDFALVNGNDWVDRKTGAVNNFDNVCDKCMKKLGLTFTLHTIDTDDYDEDTLAEGIVGGLVISDKLMDTLLEEEKCFAALYNRPIFMPKEILWPGETGYVQIFGTIEREMLVNTDVQKDADNYLAYLAMGEECILNGSSPSGYLMDNGVFFKDGRSYSPHSSAIKEESHLCKKKNNLNIVDVIDLDYLPREGVRDDFIISLDLYEYLLDEI